MRFRSFIEKFEDMFGDYKPKTVVRKEEKIDPIVVPLYRGFRGDLNNLHTEGDYYIFSPSKSEQGMLWFTNPYIRHYDAIEYARDHGDWFFMYKLNAKRHIEVEYHDDGTHYNNIPAYFQKMSNPLANSRFHAGIELPEGWVWSYKTEKFIGCTHEIKVKIEDVIPSHQVSL